VKTSCFLTILLFVIGSCLSQEAASMTVSQLRCEYRQNPEGIDTLTPRLSWKLDSDRRGQMQVSYRILVASSAENLSNEVGDLWDSGRIDSDQTLFISYAGKSLDSRQQCFWKVKSWSADDQNPSWSDSASWSMGLLDDTDWTASYIAYQDKGPVHADPSSLHLPAARQYRKEFAAKKQIARATIYSTALGIYELHLNGKRVGDAMFTPGWTDYRKRAYYNTYDVTEMIQQGDNAMGAWVADGWYSGYVGFGLLTGIGTEKTGRSTYGKTPALMAQLEIQYTDNTTETIGTDATWKVSGDGPIEEADLLMGESYDAQKEYKGWSTTGFDDTEWQQAVLAKANGSSKATFYQFRNPEKHGQSVPKRGSEEEFGFNRPKLEAFPGVPVRVTEEIEVKKVTEREPGTYVFDLGQNFAGVIRLKVKGPAGQRIRIRYAEMLHPDGRMMTENLRKARATDFYTCRGDSEGEIYQPRFTFHGFQFVEVSNFPGEATLDTVTGLVVHSDTPMTSTFECSDPMVNQLYSNVLWTQRSNFLDLPTDCPQRDERMGWTGDAQAYVATAAYNADIGAFYTKWLRELMESQRPSGVFPGYAPYPFQHGWDFGTAWADAGVICPWTIWQAYGDTEVIDNCWEPMTKFMQWRKKTSVDDLGISHGNAWGDWLAQGAETPLDYVDTIYFAISSKMMSEMAEATGRVKDAKEYQSQFDRTKAAFAVKYLRADGSVNVNTQTAQALALQANLVPEELREATGRHLAKMLEENGNHMATGFLGTRPLLPVLSSSGQHDLATFLLQSQEFPSWGYEIRNGATTIWERWDSYTKEDAFGRHNAAMNSFSHYAFGAVCEWMFRTLAGIQSDGPGYKKIIIRPTPPSPGSNSMHAPVDWVRASYDSIRGTIRSDWKMVDDRFHLNVTIPANTSATVYLPTRNAASITEGGNSIENDKLIKVSDNQDGYQKLSVPSGTYQFVCQSGIEKATVSLKTSKPKDNSVNPNNIDLAKAKIVASWDLSNEADLQKWNNRHNLEVVQRDGKTILVAAGNDSQMATMLDESVSGPLAIEIQAIFSKDVSSQFYWASPEEGFSEGRQSIRRLKPSDKIRSYLYLIEGKGLVKKIRFDPFQTYDEYADKGEMEVKSISIYQLTK
jgi:alpha-L-rhamnosidase